MSNDLPTFRKVIFKVYAIQEVLATESVNHENKGRKIIPEVGIFPVRPACNVESPAELKELSETAHRETLSYLQHPAVAVKLTVSHRQLHCVVTPQGSQVQGEHVQDRSLAALSRCIAQPPSLWDSSIAERQIIRGKIGPQPQRILIL